LSKLPDWQKNRFGRSETGAQETQASRGGWGSSR